MNKPPTREDARQEKYDKIVETLKGGGVVQVCTHLRATLFDGRHLDYFKVTANGLYARYGKRWDCIDYCALRFGRRA